MKFGLTLDNFDLTKVENYNFIKLPNFDLRTATQFEPLNPDMPRQLLKDILERFPQLKSMPSKHPAFEVNLQGEPPKLAGTTIVLDWKFHRKALENARMQAQAKRIKQRQGIEEELQRRHEHRELIKTLDKRAQFFDKVFERKDQQLATIKRANKRFIEWIRTNVDHRLDVLDEQKWQTFVLLYLKELSPSKQYYQRKAYEAQTEPTIAQLNMAEDRRISAYEHLIIALEKLIPFKEMEKVKYILLRWRRILNKRDLILQHNAEADFRIYRAFYEAFVRKDAAQDLSKEIEQAKFFKLQDQREFHQHRALEIKRNRKEIAMEHLAHQISERKALRTYLNRINHREHVNEIYHAKKAEWRAIDRKQNTYRPLEIEGQTEWVRFHPTKLQTQIKLTRYWVEVINLMFERRDTRIENCALAAREQSKTEQIEIRDHSLERALETKKIFDTKRSRELIENFHLNELVRMFAAQPLANNIMTGYHTNHIPSYYAEPEDQQEKITEVKESRFDRIA